MPKVLRLLREEITYSKAREEEVDILRRLQYYDQQQTFFASLFDKRDLIKAVVVHHLGLSSIELCEVADIEDWLHGSFNVCIPVSINGWKARAQSGTRVLVRVPLQHRVGEDFRPGNSDEKIRCEAGTYAWLQENCPDVPIPRLYGFATSDGETFTHVDELHPLSRLFQYSRRLILSYLGYQIPSSYVAHHPLNWGQKQDALATGYLIIEFVERLQSLMCSPAPHCHPKLNLENF